MYTTCSECVRRCVRWCKKNSCLTYTPAHALVPKTPVPKCMQHWLQKNAHIYILTHTCIRILMQTNTHAHAWHRRHAEALILRPIIYAQICIHIHIRMYMNAYRYIYIHTCIYIHIYMSAHIHTYICTYKYKIYICTHASTPGTTARQQPCEELMQTQEALHVSLPCTTPHTSWHIWHIHLSNIWLPERKLVKTSTLLRLKTSFLSQWNPGNFDPLF